jgi:hypothetical protein
LVNDYKNHILKIKNEALEDSKKRNKKLLFTPDEIEIFLL